MEAATPDGPTPDGPTPDGPPFPAAGREQWRELARAVLVKAGAEPDVDPFAALTRTDLDGIAVPPLLLSDDATERPAVTRAPGAWDVRVRHDDPDPARANAAVLDDLEGGASSLWLRVGPGAIAVRDLPRVLDGVLLDLVGVVLDAEPDHTAGAVAALAELAGDTTLRGSVGADPVASAFRHGSRTAAWRQVIPRAGLRAVTVDGTAYADAGASDVDEVAFATAAAVAYLRELDGDFGAVEFRFAVADRQFPAIAKLRAARRIWARVAELSGAPGAAQVQHAVTAAAMYSVRDPWVNMLRATVSAFAAATGGADAITVHPFDLAVGRPAPFARRIARNVQAILHDEASLARVLDPAAGSWYVEWLTDQIAQRAWDRFTEVEREGGIFAALSNGFLAEAVSATAERRERRVATRATPLTGVSEFPDLAEKPVERPDAPAQAGLRRWAEPFEALRDRGDEVLAATGARPTVQLLTFGARGAAAARAAFATNLFQSGGLAVELVTDAAQCNGPLVCLCSSDTGYADDGAGLAAAARAAGARQVWLAGRGDVEGVDAAVSAGGDALEALHRAWDVLTTEVDA